MTTNELATVLDGFFRSHAEKSFGADQLIAIFAAIVALGALYVAYKARKDSEKSAMAAEKSADATQKSNELMARQLDLEIKRHTHELEKEVSESSPIISWSGGSSGGDYFDRQFVNHGGDIQNLTITTNAIEANITPITSLQHNATGNIHFSGRRILPITFTIGCQTKLGNHWEKTYKLTEAGIGEA